MYLKNIIYYLYMPIYTDPSNNIKYAYSSMGLLDEIEPETGYYFQKFNKWHWDLFKNRSQHIVR